MKKMLIVCCVVVMFASVSFADWNVGDDYKMHYPQLPDLNDTGMDVLANWPYPGSDLLFGKVLADDWQCSETGPVTDIHIWGSWLNDVLPVYLDSANDLIADPGLVAFKLSIHEDIPAWTDADGTFYHSEPGAELWSKIFEPGDPNYKVRLYDAPVSESFYDPNIDRIIGSDTEVYQYNFFIDDTAADPAFYQKQGDIYWLDVIAMPVGVPDTVPPVWGWKTSLDHWNDDAVFGDIDDPWISPDHWMEMHYPEGHLYEGESIDLAFVITPEPATMVVLGLGSAVFFACRRHPRRRRKAS